MLFSKKIFLIFLILLTFIIIGELLYFYNINHINKIKNSYIKEIASKELEKIKIPSIIFPTHKPTLTINELLEWKFVWIEGLTNKVELTTYNEGIIESIFINNYITENNNDYQKLIINLKSLENPSIINTFQFTDKYLKKIKFYSKKTDQKNEIKPEEFKKGDKIRLIIKGSIYPEHGSITEGYIIKL